MNMGANYGVNPVIFACIYVGSSPVMWLSLAWMVRNIRRKKPVYLPGLLSGLSFFSIYIYLFAVGRHVPVGVYVLLGLLTATGAISSGIRLRRMISNTS